MKHTIGADGFVVPFGTVTAVSPTIPAVGKYGKPRDGSEKVFQQGQKIPAGWLVIAYEGETENPDRNTDALEAFFPEPVASTPAPKWKSGKGDDA